MTATTYIAGPRELSESRDFRDALSAESGFQSFLERDVVIRRLRGEAAASPRARTRFVAEVRALAALSHQSFIRVYDAGVEGDIPFAVFERLHGITAQHRLDLLADRGARMTADEAVHIVRGVAEGVEYARCQGARVHDVSPANIVLAEERRVVLAGLGQPLPDNPLLASTTALAYAAPELLFGAPRGQAGDVYSLGVLLAHLIFGRSPFDGTAVGVLAQKQQTGSLPILEDGQTALECPYPLAAVIHRATSAEPDERYPGVSELVAALLDSMGGRPARAVARWRRDGGPGWRQAAGPPRASYAGPGWLSRADEEEPDYARWPGRREAEQHARQGAVRDLVAAHATAPQQASTIQPPLAPQPPAAPQQPTTAQLMNPYEAAGEPAAPAGYDPLMPGLDNPALEAALPYTILVPMPPGAEEPQAAPERLVLRQSFLSPVHLAVLMVLGAMAISAALMFG